MSRIFSINRPSKIKVTLTSESIAPPFVASAYIENGDCACGMPSAAVSPGNLLPLNFANRKEKLRVICTSGKPLLLIDAPSGYGKTRVLEKVKSSLEGEWKCAIVDLGQFQGKQAIRNKITDQIKVSKIFTSDDQEADNLLMGILGDAGKIILMFDSIEMARESDREWLLDDFMPDCIKNIPGAGFRVIVAGRSAGVTFPTTLRGYESISLAPFSLAVVEEVLRDALKICPPPPEREIDIARLKNWSRHIVRLSGGHPRSIQKLITDLAREKHWIINFPRQERRLFTDHVANEIDLIIDDLSDHMRQALEILSVFRIFNFNGVQALQNTELPSGFEFPKDIDARNVVTELCEKGLVCKTDPTSTFYSDKAIRNLILARIRIFHPIAYQELNHKAREIYDAWIELLIQPKQAYGPIDPQEFLKICTKESIYHFCQGFLDDNRPTQTEMANCLRKYSDYLVQGLGEDKHDHHYGKLLKDMVIGDAEIRETLEEHRFDFQTLWAIACETQASIPPVSKPNGDTTPIDRKLRVFLCHASQDKPAVREIHKRLAVKGWVEPWLAEEELLPGQDWQMEIEKAMETADAVIVCLSHHSVNNEGHVHRELDFMLDIAHNKPEGVIFIIPLRLDECEIPRSIRSRQGIDYFPEEQRGMALEKIFKSLEERQKNLPQK